MGKASNNSGSSSFDDQPTTVKLEKDPAAAALGTIFEFGRIGHLRHLCTGWVKWADEQLTAVARAWRAATAGLP